MKNLTARNIVLIIISILLGAFFIFSAYAKTMPIDNFSNIIFNRIAISWHWASWIARGFIGLEAAVGVLMLFHIYGKRKWVLWLTLFLLIIFSGYLVGLWYTDGNDVDCGCMGNVVKMNPLWSLIKNAVLIILVSLLIKLDRQQINPSKNIGSVIIALVIAAIPFIAFPNKLPIHIIYENGTVTTLKDDLRKGKHLVAFMSLTCPHCKAAAVKLDSLKMQDTSLPLHIIFMDRPDRDTLLNEFKEETHIENISYDFLEEKKFIQLAGDFVPSIYLINNEKVDDRIEPHQLNKDFLDDWLRR